MLDAFALMSAAEAAINRMAEVVTDAVNRAGEGLQGELRSQVRAAGLSKGLEKAWQNRVYPSRRTSAGSAALVYSRATVLHSAYIEGPTITPHGLWLVIATPEAIAMGFGYAADKPRGPRDIPGGQARKYSQLEKAERALGVQNLRRVSKGADKEVIIYSPPQRRSGLGARGSRAFRGAGGRGFQLLRGSADIVLFTLVRQTRVKRVLDLDGPADRCMDRLYGDIAAGLGED
jgi:hypothetical protein